MNREVNRNKVFQKVLHREPFADRPHHSVYLFVLLLIPSLSPQMLQALNSHRVAENLFLCLQVKFGDLWIKQGHLHLLRALSQCDCLTRPLFYGKHPLSFNREVDILLLKLLFNLLIEHKRNPLVML